MQNQPTHNPEPTTQAIRALLFQKAEARNEQVLKCLTDIAGHLRANHELAVICALTGIEGDVAHIRTLMVLCRDFFRRTEKAEK
jgi:hypothetical protein